MLFATRRRSAVKITLAISALGVCAGSASAAALTGGASVGADAQKRTASSPAATVAPSPTAKSSTPALAPVASMPDVEAGVAFRKVGRRAVTAATVTYVSRAERAVRVRVDVVRLADGLSVFSDERTVSAGETQTVRWTGRARSGLALDGRYQLRIGRAPAQSAESAGALLEPSAGPGGAAPTLAAPPPGSTPLRTFNFVGGVFPVRGKHDYGGSAARFGAGRGGGGHGGHDVMAACGTPLVAARGGIVIMRATHGRAGNYVVIHDPITRRSHMYAHLAAPATVRRGQRVETGQPIGVVGQTGSATACHLHFELWSAPGWYRGGSPLNPLPTLKRWDRYS